MNYVVKKGEKYFAGEKDGSPIWVERSSAKVITFARKDVAKGWARSLHGKIELAS